jgi:hypothetical protein
MNNVLALTKLNTIAIIAAAVAIAAVGRAWRASSSKLT